jgi:hypothetical protein
MWGDKKAGEVAYVCIVIPLLKSAGGRHELPDEWPFCDVTSVSVQGICVKNGESPFGGPPLHDTSQWRFEDWI